MIKFSIFLYLFSRRSSSLDRATDVASPTKVSGLWCAIESRSGLKSYCALGLISLGKATDHGAVTKAPDTCLGKIHPYYICTFVQHLVSICHRRWNVVALPDSNPEKIIYICEFMI